MPEESGSNSSSLSSPTSPTCTSSLVITDVANTSNKSNGHNPSEGNSRKKEKRSDSGKHPVYRGVRMRAWGKWVSEIRQPRKKSRIWLGTFPTADMAARAHDVAELSIKGNSAILNFPQLADSLPRPLSLMPRDIQTAAAKAAAMVQINSSSSSSSSSTSSSSQASESSSSLSVFEEVEESEEEYLSEIVELPNIEGSFDGPDQSKTEFILFDSVDGWIYPPLDLCGEFSDQLLVLEKMISCNYGGSVGD